MEYTGDIIDVKEYETRSNKYEKQDRGYYIFRVDNDVYIDATNTGGNARYFNHSCEPNCESRTVYVGGVPKIIYFSLRKIEKEEEVIFSIISKIMMT